MTARMSGTDRDRLDRERGYDRNRDDRDLRDRDSRYDRDRFDGDRDDDRDRDRDRHGRTDPEHVVRPTGEREHRLLSKTSAAAVFSLVFGLSALFCALTAILSPVAVVFGLIGIVLGVVGLKMARRPGVTGRGVAIGGLVTSVLGLLLGAVVIAGLSVIVNDEQRLDDLQQRIENVRDDLPSSNEIREELPAG